MLGNKNRTAVLIRQNGGLIGINLFCDGDDILLVHGNKRPVYRHMADFVGHSQRLHRLAGHLTDAFSRDQTQTLSLICKMLCNFHHITAHDDGQVLMRTFLVDMKLDIRKIHNVQLNGSRILRHLLRQVNDLLFCPLAGVRRCVKIGGLDGHSPLGDHIARYRTVNSAGK